MLLSFRSYVPLGVNDFGWMPMAKNTDANGFPVGSQIPLSDYLEYSSDSGWSEYPYSGVRIGLLTSVPVPSAICLFPFRVQFTYLAIVPSAILKQPFLIGCPNTLAKSDCFAAACLGRYTAKPIR